MTALIGTRLTAILNEAKRLYDLGFGVHWIRPNSKAPVKAEWTKPERDNWKTVLADYRTGYGLGVCTGSASKLIDGGYLANIDIDLKSKDPKHEKEVQGILEEKFPGLFNRAPVVRTGNGFRLFIKTQAPLKSGKLGTSAEETIVRLPTTEINRRQTAAVQAGRLTQVQLEAGYRVRPAWEIELMSTGRQVVLPPSIHPETGTPYVWVSAVSGPEDLPLVVMDRVPTIGVRGRRPGSAVIQNFKAVDVDLGRLPDALVGTIVDGEGVEDRSAALFGVCVKMLKAGLSELEILSVLTNPQHFLAETAYEHAQTKSRAVAAAWVRNYTLRKVKLETGARAAFREPVEELPPLSDKAAALQMSEMVMPYNWWARLERSGKQGTGPLKPTLKNTVTILENTVPEGVFRFDTFGNRKTYGEPAPWGGKRDQLFADHDTVEAKLWLSREFKFEPPTHIVYEALVCMFKKHSHNPVIDELEALPEWDGIERIDNWLRKHFKCKDKPEYAAQVFRKWLVASITRTYYPGYKFDWIPIFEGFQGAGKSSFGAILFGQSYFTDGLPRLEDKDAALGLVGRRCIEFGELATLRRAEVETIKAFITRQIDKLRPPYGREYIECARTCVFFGTTNREEYLRDETGNRRFMPLQVGALDFKALIRDRDQLWAEALFIYNTGLEPSLYLDDDAKDYAEEIREDKRTLNEADRMADLILDEIEKQEKSPEKGRFDFTKFRIYDLFGPFGPLKEIRNDMRNIQFAASALKKINDTTKIRFLSFRMKRGRFWKGVGVV